jgi:hypothetical protein
MNENESSKRAGNKQAYKHIELMWARDVVLSRGPLSNIIRIQRQKTVETPLSDTEQGVCNRDTPDSNVWGVQNTGYPD